MVVELFPFGLDSGVTVKGHIGGPQGHLPEGAPIVEAAEIIGHLRWILKVNTSPCFEFVRRVWPCSLQKWGMSMADTGSLASTFSTWPDCMESRRFRAFSTGRGQRSPVRSMNSSNSA